MHPKTHAPMNPSLKNATAFIGYLLGSSIITITFIIEKIAMPIQFRQDERQIEKA
jgi:membrane protein insertase Oxa1/YidC/SpoIIIJ